MTLEEAAALNLSLTVSRVGNVLLLAAAVVAAVVAYNLWRIYNSFLDGDVDTEDAAEAAAEVSRICNSIHELNRALSCAQANSGSFRAIHIAGLGAGEEIDLGLLSPEEAASIAERRLKEAHGNLRAAMRRLRKV